MLMKAARTTGDLLVTGLYLWYLVLYVAEGLVSRLHGAFELDGVMVRG